MSMSRILIIDDDKAVQTVLAEILRQDGYDLLFADNGIEAIRILKTEPVDVVFLDVRLPGKGGIEVLEEIKAEWNEVEVVLISGHATVETAVKAIKLGAYDCLEKPLDMSRVLTIARNAVRMEALRRENAALRQSRSAEVRMIGDTAGMRRIREIVDQSAPSDSRVMILGENGTGKELVARMIHTRSARAGGSFVEVNCAAIPDNLIESELFGHEKGAFTGASARRRGKFEMADGGTLFLDEVADMSLEAQAKVLRAVQEMTFERIGGEEPIHVDVRIISATNKDILEEVRRGRFREDLYFRLNVIPIAVPPLRERPEDLPVLIDYFHGLLSGAPGERSRVRFSREAMKRLTVYSWPGNIRELRNFIERVTVMADEAEISAETADYYLGEAGTRGSPNNEYDSMKLIEARDTFERRLIERRLEANGGNIARTAQDLGIYPSNLHGKIKKFGIEIRK